MKLKPIDKKRLSNKFFDGILDDEFWMPWEECDGSSCISCSCAQTYLLNRPWPPRSVAQAILDGELQSY